MNDYSDMTDGATAAIIRDLTIQTAGADVLEPGAIYAWLSPQSGQVQLVDLTDDKYLPEPKRKRGTVTVWDVASFLTYYGKHKINGDTEIFASETGLNVTAVLNGHSATQAHWQDHRLQLKLVTTAEWTAWMARNRTYMPQIEFAEFIQDHIADIAGGGRISATDLLTLSQHFTASRQISYGFGKRLKDGATQLIYTEVIDASGGQAGGTIDIPDTFDLAIRPFEDSEPVRVKAWFRHRIKDRQLMLAFFIDKPEQIVKAAMDEITVKISEATGDPVMYGSPS